MAGENCNKTRCCKAPGTACYQKDKEWAACRIDCVPGPYPVDDNDSPWNCTQLGMHTPGVPITPVTVGKWVKKECSQANENCIDSRCCSGEGFQCFEKNAKKAQCLRNCE